MDSTKEVTQPRSELTDAGVAVTPDHSRRRGEVLRADAPLPVPELALRLDLPVDGPGLAVEDPVRFGVLAVVVDHRS